MGNNTHLFGPSLFRAITTGLRVTDRCYPVTRDNRFLGAQRTRAKRAPSDRLAKRFRAVLRGCDSACSCGTPLAHAVVLSSLYP
jgi:hypothetical protein